MGGSVSWFAVGMKPAASVLKSLFLQDTGADVLEGSCKIAGALLPNGWYVVVLNEFWHPLINPISMECLSMECVVVGCSESDNTNTSLAFLYSEERRQWQVSHTLDEGIDHLMVEGKPPESVGIALAQAKKESREKRYDAVFGVPATLAQQVCGFRHLALQDLRFTELVPIPRISQAHIAESLLPRIETVLLAHGFVKDSGVVDHQFVSKTAQDEVRCFFSYSNATSGGCWVSMHVMVCNHYVQELSTGVPGYGHTLTYKKRLNEIFDLPGLVNAAEDLAQWTSQIEAKLPALVDSLRSIAGLDALANDRSPRRGFRGEPTLSHYDTETGLSRLVLAYLARNPQFERMVAETDAASYGGASPTNPVHELVAFLKAHAKPVI